MGTEKEEEGENRENRRTMNFEQKAENGRKHANEKTFSPLLSPSLSLFTPQDRGTGHNTSGMNVGVNKSAQVTVVCSAVTSDQ